MTGFWAHLQIFDHTFNGPQKKPVPHWIALKPHFVQEPQKFFISFPLDIEHGDAIWEHWEL